MITNATWIYLIKVNIALVVFYLFYRLLFSRDTFFTFRRVYLLASLTLACLYPMFLFSFGEDQKVVIHHAIAQYASNLLPEVAVGAPSVPVEINVFDVLCLGYLGVVIFLLGRIMIQVFSIFQLLKKRSRAVCFSTPIILLKGEVAPFSFFKWIFINPSLYESNDLQEIMMHEKTHVDQYHSLDVMVSELLCTLFWINPAMWLLKGEIRRNLEFLADKRVVNSGIDRKAYQYHLLRLSHPSAAAQIVNKFIVTPLKKSIMMMNKKRTSKMGLLKYALLFPVVALLVLSSNVQAVVYQGDYRDTVILVDKGKLIVSGTVVDQYNRALRGVSVLIKNTAEGTHTGWDGKFMLAVDKGTELVFSHAGKKNMLVPVKVGDRMRVRMLDDTSLPMVRELEYEGSDSDIFQVVEDMPQFLGGSVQKYVAQHIKYPKEAMEKNIQGKVFVQFIISKTGEVTDVKVARAVHPLLDAEAIRVVQEMPNWKPGTQRGKAVRVSYTVPINFQLQEPVSKEVEKK